MGFIKSYEVHRVNRILIFVLYYHLGHLLAILKLLYRNRCYSGDLVEDVEAK